MSLAVFLRQRFAGFALDIAFETRGAVTALFGPSGAGKSTTVGAIAGLIRPDEGRIAVNGRLLLDTAARVFVPAERRRIAVVFQDARLFPHMTVADNLRFGWRRAGTKAAPGEIDHVVALLGLEHLLARRPANLSGGEKGRVALGRALLSSPDLLLLDEPLASLDAARRNEILPYLERLARETRLPMLYVSHAVEEVARLADEVVVLRAGRVVAQGPVFELLADVDGVAGVPPVGAVFEAKIAAHRADGLTELVFDGGRLFVRKLTQPLDASVRVRMRAEDIMLAREEPRAISANNVLACAVTAVRIHGEEADVQLACGTIRLAARITHASAGRLALAPGVMVHAIVKTVTVERETG